MLTLISLLLFMSTSFAQDATLELENYIQTFNMRPLPPMVPRKHDLYQLGARLFFDKDLSGKGNISCHDCHAMSAFSGDQLPLGLGEGAMGIGKEREQSEGAILPRHTPSLYNLGFNSVTAFFWDGRVQRDPRGGWITPEEKINGPTPKLPHIAHSLDSLLAVQALFPIANHEEMLGRGSSLSAEEAWEAVMKRILSGKFAEQYKKLFRKAYPSTPEYNIAHVGNALAEFQRHQFLANKTPWDLYLNGEEKALTSRMKRGANIFFGKAQCINCHSGEHLSSFGFQSVAIPQIGPGKTDGDDKGRFEVTQNSADIYRFRVSPLRNTALTAPYMHSGAFQNMWQVIEHYDHPMRSLHHPQWDPKHPQYREDLVLDRSRENMMNRMRSLPMNLPRNLALSVEEKRDLYCFLMVALTDKKYHKRLAEGLMDEVSDCSPRGLSIKKGY
jgi:cytochrome c peroxidase